MRIRQFVIIFCFMMLPVQVIAQTVIYEQTTVETSDRGAYQYFNQQLADDFMPLVSGIVGDMTWQGSYYSTDNPAATESFTIQYFTDSAGLPETVPFFEATVDAAKSPAGTLLGKTLYEYSTSLQSGPNLVTGTLYWVNIYSNDSPTNYAWTNSLDGSTDGALRSANNPWGPLNDATRSNHIFSLFLGAQIDVVPSTPAVPVPTMSKVMLAFLVMLILGAGLLYRRRLFL